VISYIGVVGPQIVDNGRPTSHFYNDSGFWGMDNNKNGYANGTKIKGYGKGNTRDGAIIQMTVDRIKHTLGFVVDGYDCGLLCDSLPVHGHLRLAFSAFYARHTLTIIN